MIKTGLYITLYLLFSTAVYGTDDPGTTAELSIYEYAFSVVQPAIPENLNDASNVKPLPSLSTVELELGLLNLSINGQPLAIVRRFRPTVNVRESGKQEWVEARVAQQLFHSDTLRTEQDGYAVVQMVDNSLIRVRPNSMLIIRGDVNDRGGVNTRIDMEQGGINLQVSGRVSEFEVTTQTSVAAVKGTQFSVVINPDGSTTIVCFSGEIEVTARNTGQSVDLRRGRRAIIDTQGRSVRAERVSVREMRRLEAAEVQMEASSIPDVLRIRLRNAEGDIREVEIPYFRNSQ